LAGRIITAHFKHLIGYKPYTAPYVDLILANYYAREKSTREFKNQHNLSQTPNGVIPLWRSRFRKIDKKKWGLKKCNGRCELHSTDSGKCLVTGS
jgi:hypothetical protein